MHKRRDASLLQVEPTIDAGGHSVPTAAGGEQSDRSLASKVLKHAENCSLKAIRASPKDWRVLSAVELIFDQSSAMISQSLRFLFAMASGATNGRLRFALADRYRPGGNKRYPRLVCGASFSYWPVDYDGIGRRE